MTDAGLKFIAPALDAEKVIPGEIIPVLDLDRPRRAVFALDRDARTPHLVAPIGRALINNAFGQRHSRIDRPAVSLGQSFKFDFLADSDFELIVIFGIDPDPIAADTVKELKREGFQLARERYDELRPILDRLGELELQQKETPSKKDRPESSSKSSDKREKKSKKSSK